MRILWTIYVAGALIALWRTDASWPMRIALAIAWPLGPIAFLATVAILLSASVIAFPLVAGLIAALTAGVAWWWMN